jgi:hypothetical protein
MKTLNDYQQHFTTDLNLLPTTKQGNLMWLSQNHFGDYLIEEHKQELLNGNWERWELWRNLDENVADGEPLIQVMYCGSENSYTSTVKFEL